MEGKLDKDILEVGHIIKLILHLEFDSQHDNRDESH